MFSDGGLDGARSRNHRHRFSKANLGTGQESWKGRPWRGHLPGTAPNPLQPQTRLTALPYDHILFLFFFLSWAHTKPPRTSKSHDPAAQLLSSRALDLLHLHEANSSCRMETAHCRSSKTSPAPSHNLLEGPKNPSSAANSALGLFLPSNHAQSLKGHLGPNSSTSFGGCCPQSFGHQAAEGSSSARGNKACSESPGLPAEVVVGSHAISI